MFDRPPRASPDSPPLPPRPTTAADLRGIAAPGWADGFRGARDSLDDAWTDAEVELPEGGRITVIIEAWDADMVRLDHAGMHRNSVSAAAALRALAAKLREREAAR